jgi:adenylate cyclase
MGTEIERKWRLSNPPFDILKRWEHRQVRIEQWYLVSNDHGEVRLRKEGDQFMLTFKSDGTMSRTEENYELESSLGYRLLESRKVGDVIVKDRYSIPSAVLGIFRPHRKFEFDLYLGALSRLMILEVEFPDVASAEAFVLPGEAGEALEVTDDKRYKNKNLALHQEAMIRELGL